MNLIGFFCLAWALLACDQDEGKDNPGVSFPDYGCLLYTSGEPIIGATIREQGTTNGTVTGIDGGFSLDVADNVNLEISYIGYETRKIRAQQGKKLDIIMRDVYKRQSLPAGARRKEAIRR